MSDDVRIIKRYANRKLYDTQHSKYVTLEQISEMIRRGDDVKIIDNKSKEDLTSVTLAQIIFEEEKKQKSFLPLQAMRNIIQNGGDSITQFVSQAQRRVESILPRKGKDGEVAPDGVPNEPAPVVSDSEVETKKGGLHDVREWLANSQRAIDQWQEKVDERIRNMRESLSHKGAAGDTEEAKKSPVASIQEEMAKLMRRIGELEAKLRRAEDEAKREK